MKQTEAREQALTALYAADSNRTDEVDTDGLTRRASSLAVGTWTRRSIIDQMIVNSASNWTIERMAVVDRNILRMATYEMKFMDTKMAIVIDEAVELAKTFSTANSPAFINGVLSAVAIIEIPEPVVEAEAGESDAKSIDSETTEGVVLSGEETDL